MAEGSSSSSLTRLMSILDIFTETRPEWSSDAMIAELGYPRPTLYRYLKVLTDSGMLASNGHGIYTLGPKVVEMDHLLRLSDRLVGIGRPVVERLTEQYACTAFLVRWYRNRLLCMHSETSLEAPLSSYPRGRVMPMNRGAIARTILAHLQSRKARKIIESFAPEGPEDARKAYIDEQISALREVRRNGYAIAFGEVTPGVVGVASPIFDEAAEPAGALCMTMRQEDCPRELRTLITQAVPVAATSITVTLRQSRHTGAEHTNLPPQEEVKHQ
ncbi:IclR family transcriptional regulator [Modicisalibacter radicis]|uniref:IclR family transcriptional regulator n=1 Tax=Halomonas sp. EAR18 TaxID=2518972 RepID=UPI00109D228C|nr:IclR family transcriptional regulator [Halomonas sp. EAR18]